MLVAANLAIPPGNEAAVYRCTETTILFLPGQKTPMENLRQISHVRLAFADLMR